MRVRERSAASFAKHRRCAMRCTARPRRASLRCIRTSLPTPQYQKRFFCSCYRSLFLPCACPLRARPSGIPAYLPPRPEIKRIPRSLFLDIPFINPYNKHREFPCNIKIAAGWSAGTLQALLSGVRAPSSNPIWDTAIKYHYTFPRE